MSIRIWLTAAADKSLETKTEKKPYSSTETHEVSRLNGLEVKSDQAGAKYIDLSADPLDPASNVPVIDRKYVKRVSFMDRYHEGFRTDGIYKLKGATARVETKHQFHGGFEAKEQLEETYQEISVSAGSVKTLREIYSKVRTGELKADADWGIHQAYIDQKAREAKKNATPADEVASAEVH